MLKSRPAIRSERPSTLHDRADEPIFASFPLTRSANKMFLLITNERTIARPARAKFALLDVFRLSALSWPHLQCFPPIGRPAPDS